MAEAPNLQQQTQKPSESPVFGCAVLLIFAIIGGFYVYRYFVPGNTQPINLTLSAYFVDSAGVPIPQKSSGESHLKIKGEAYRTGKPVESGNVRVAVNKLDDSFRQSISLDLKEGKFETEDVAFRALTPADKIHVKADISSEAGSSSDEIYVGTAAPALTPAQSYGMWVGVSVVLIIFLWWFFRNFTGPRTPGKNRQAIIFSYLFGGIFLAVPLLAPVLLLQLFPNVQRAMVGMPVGLVLTRMGTPDEARRQWALNIGGYSRISSLEEVDNSSAAATPTPTPTANAPGQSTRSPVTRVTPGATPTPVQSPASTPQATVAASTPTPSGDASRGVATASVTPTPTAAESEPEESWDGVVKVEGGLVIPLYVIILSVIGGAINMTRKVPRFQGEGEYSEPTGLTLPRSPFGPVRRIFTSAKNRLLNRTSSKDREDKTLGEGKGEGEESSKEDAKIETSGAKPEFAVTAGETEPPKPEVGKPTPTPQTKTSASDKDKPAKDAESSLNDQALAIDVDLDVLVREQLKRHSDTRGSVAKIRADVQRMQKLFEERTDERRLLGFESFEAWLSNRVGLKEVLGSNWRVELLNQYMYLISAPFLALVAYFMIDLLGLQNKLAVVVLISFSVGLISERILSWLLGMASGYLQGGKGQPTNP